MYADGKTAQVDVCVTLPHVTDIIALLSNGGLEHFSSLVNEKKHH